MANINYKIDDYSVKQGQKFNSYQNDYANIIGKKRLELIEQTTSKNLLSLHENMETLGNPISKENASQMEKLKTLETQFNFTLNEYKHLYEEYLKNVVNMKDEIRLYKNQNVMDGNGKFYYVNEYGYTRGYPNNSFENKPSSCAQSKPTDNSVDIYNKLMHGKDYSSGQPCNLDGKNIRNEKTGHLAFVSPDGVKHFYPNQDILDAARKNGCPNDEIKVSDDVYNMFPSGDDMNSSFKCFENNKGSFLMNSIVKLNSNLMSISQEMYNITEQMDSKDDALGSKLTIERNNLQSEINNLDSEKKKLEQLQSSVNRLNGELEETEIMTNMEYLQYIGWTVGAIGLTILATRHITS